MTSEKTKRQNAQDTPEEILEDLMQSEYYLVERLVPKVRTGRVGYSRRPQATPEELAEMDAEFRKLCGPPEDPLTEEELREMDREMDAAAAYQMEMIKRQGHLIRPIPTDIAQQIQAMMDEKIKNPSERPDKPQHYFYVTPSLEEMGKLVACTYAGYHGWKFLQDRHRECYVFACEDVETKTYPTGYITFDIRPQYLMGLGSDITVVSISSEGDVCSVRAITNRERYFQSLFDLLKRNPHVSHLKLETQIIE